MERVVITGFGLLSPCGNSAQSFWEQVSQGISGLGPVTRVDASLLGNNVAGEVRGFNPDEHFGRQIDLLDRFAQLGLVAARQALADAGLATRLEEGNGGPAPHRVGVLTGTALGGVESEDASFYQLYGKKSPRLHPFCIPRMMFNAASAHISMESGAQGPCFAVSSACASATHALGEAMRMVRNGTADIMLAGGADAPLTLGVFKAWEAMRVLAPPEPSAQAACRPFSVDRAGLVLSEGAAMFVLESERSARRRGARIYAELAGYGASADASHITLPSQQGPLRAMQQALLDAGLNPGDIDYINAHGTATRVNDPIESAAIGSLLGEHASTVAVSSTKSVHGHAMGASGALELAATLLAMQNNCVPPTANVTEVDPECNLDITPNQPKAKTIRAALSNSFAFGGLNAVVALRQFK